LWRGVGFSSLPVACGFLGRAQLALSWEFDRLQGIRSLLRVRSLAGDSIALGNSIAPQQVRSLLQFRLPEKFDRSAASSIALVNSIARNKKQPIDQTPNPTLNLLATVKNSKNTPIFQSRNAVKKLQFRCPNSGVFGA
jgi:hypothetical protein